MDKPEVWLSVSLLALVYFYLDARIEARKWREQSTYWSKAYWALHKAHWTPLLEQAVREQEADSSVPRVVISLNPPDSFH